MSECSECGAELPEEIDEGTGVYCTECGTGQHVTDGGTDLWVCGGCKAAWSPQKVQENPSKFGSHSCPSCPDVATDGGRDVVEMDIDPFTGADSPDQFVVTVDGRAYVVGEETLRSFLSDGLRAVGSGDGTVAWRVER